MELQENLVKLVQWCLYSYMTQRQLLHAQATQDKIDNVNSWLDLLPEEVGETTVEKYKDSCNPRHWIESIRTYFSVKKGAAQMPLLYVIRKLAALPANNPGFGNPDFSTELVSRGRHDGHYYRAYNRAVWLFLKLKCH